MYMTCYEYSLQSCKFNGRVRHRFQEPSGTLRQATRGPTRTPNAGIASGIASGNLRGTFREPAFLTLPQTCRDERNTTSL